MDLKSTWDNDQEIFHSFTDAKVNKKFSMFYEEFKDHCSSVGGFTNNPILYLMRKNLIPKDEADDHEEDYVMLYLQIIQRADISKATNVNDVNMETSGSRAKEAYANTDNAKLFDLAKTAFCKTSLWVHAKPSQRGCNGRQELKLI